MRRTLPAILILLLAGCGGGGSTQSDSAAVTLSITANPLSIGTGTAATLSWTTTNATTCTASGGWSGAKATSGSQSTGALSATTLYTLTCAGNGDSASQSVTVTVTSPPPVPTVTLNASPTTVSSGGTSTLTWSSTNATACTASGGWSGAKATSGNQSTGALSATTTFNLSCTGAGGTANTSRTVTVTSPPPVPTVTLNASPTTVSSGGTSTLTWSSTNATACTASGGWSGAKATSGNQSTGALSATTTFDLSCTGAGGTANTSRTVTVATSASLYPLHTEAGKRYLIDAQNTPFFMNGDTAWSLIVQLNAAETEQYLEDRRQRGINTVLVELIEHEFADNAPRNRAGQAPFLTAGDYATPNDAYFDYALSVIDLAAAKGMLVLLTPSYMGYPGASPVEGWYQEMTTNGTTKLRNYGRYIGQRFAGRDNILWVHGGDRDPPASPGLQLANAIREGIVEYDPTGRWLHTWHAERGTSAGDSVAGNEPWLSVNNIYTSSSDVVSEAFDEYASSNLPVFLSEARYEDNGGDGPFIRQQAYQSLLSGAIAGHLMGNDPMWYFGSNWQNFLDSEGARSMSPIKSLFTTRQWWLLAPDTGGSFLTGGINSGADRAVASLASDDGFGLVYTPAVRTLTVNLARLAGPQVTARWYDPANGTYSTIAGSPFSTAGSQSLTPAGNNSQGAGDWVLVLESVP